MAQAFENLFQVADSFTPLVHFRMADEKTHVHVARVAPKAADGRAHEEEAVTRERLLSTEKPTFSSETSPPSPEPPRRGDENVSTDSFPL